MVTLEGKLAGPRDSKLFYQAWLPPGDPKAVLLLVRCAQLVHSFGLNTHLTSS